MKSKKVFYHLATTELQQEVIETSRLDKTGSKIKMFLYRQCKKKDLMRA